MTLRRRDKLRSNHRDGICFESTPRLQCTAVMFETRIGSSVTEFSSTLNGLSCTTNCHSVQGRYDRGACDSSKTPPEETDAIPIP